MFHCDKRAWRSIWYWHVKLQDWTHHTESEGSKILAHCYGDLQAAIYSNISMEIRTEQVIWNCYNFFKRCHQDGGHLKDLLEVYGLKNFIRSPTRMGKTSSTLLDLILTNNSRRLFSSGVVDADISDHSLIYTFLKTTAPRLRSRKIQLRSLKNFDKDFFLREIRVWVAVPWHSKQARTTKASTHKGQSNSFHEWTMA